MMDYLYEYLQLSYRSHMNNKNLMSDPLQMWSYLYLVFQVVKYKWGETIYTWDEALQWWPQKSDYKLKLLMLILFFISGVINFR